MTTSLVAIPSGRGTIPSRRAGRVIHSQLPAIHDLGLEHLLRLLRGRDIHKVCVGETSGLPGAAVDSHADVEDIADFAEEICSHC